MSSLTNISISDINQERIVQEGGLDALLKLVESSQNTTILRVASGAIANLAMNGIPQLTCFSINLYNIPEASSSVFRDESRFDNK